MVCTKFKKIKQPTKLKSSNNHKMVFHDDNQTTFLGVFVFQRTLMNGVMAESEGFEPSMQLPAYLLSREALSTTQPTLRFFGQEL